MSSIDSESVIHVIGGGLAGCEVAWQLGRRSIPVVLHEMRPKRQTEAHQSDRLAELVCSNTLGSKMPHTAPGIFKAELRELGSLVLAAGEEAYVPAGGALAVDREQFASSITDRLEALASVQIRREEVLTLPSEGPTTVVATGPLTAPSLASEIQRCTGTEDLYFYDAIAPIVSLESVDPEIGFWSNRYEGKEAGDYYNLPFTREQYEVFIEALVAGESVPSKNFEKEVFFQGCQPIEAIAATGKDSLRFGPMKPVGLVDPRTGRRPWAVVQLRRETRTGTAMNLVGFQTKLRYGAQTEVFRKIPGLAEAEFLRLGSVHRNTFINTPKILDHRLALPAQPHLRFAGQIVGCEGYTESSAMGLWVALNLVAEREGRVLKPPPRGTMFGALLAYLREADPKRFQPMNVNFGLLPDDGKRVKKRDKKQHRISRGQACVETLSRWAAEMDIRFPMGVGPLEGPCLSSDPRALAPSSPAS